MLIMKKVMAFAAFVGICAFAQAQTSTGTSTTKTERLTNADTANFLLPTKGISGGAMVQVSLDRVSGSMSGDVLITASLDGAKYDTIPGLGTPIAYTNAASYTKMIGIPIPAGLQHYPYVYLIARVRTAGTTVVDAKATVVAR